MKYKWINELKRINELYEMNSTVILNVDAFTKIVMAANKTITFLDHCVH